MSKKGQSMKPMKDLERKSSVAQTSDNLNWSQKYAKPIRPQKPSDNTQGQDRYQLGTMPKGGFQAVWDFSSPKPYSSHLSPTSRPGNAGGKKII
jgi:hypothetical protein